MYLQGKSQVSKNNIEFIAKTIHDVS